ncbi:MFS transporter [Stackebrandtia nassauensis]|uniref:Drug resistance transporter, EmrB/QacA subfamily n=1 Tax=Stackebrandtia nassauensis (strain DSM 44728 / CIP 108903 / NRRL B-16338 / NBRC 102104 / LLR-40K-21) TaxID=446470 RepID=D3Q487_STANL|nr:MFS transporter [Stackebrandtia nassauensis]ADD45972.1 drug resistance transporter, EmrB/QacA subfamily [Stackebrandtia nassauensis DSM 44728]
MAEESQAALATPAGRGIVLAAVLGSSVALLDGTVVNVALPHIGGDLGSGMDGLQWIVNGYTLMLAALVLTGGALGDRFGRRRLFLVGVIWFGVASALCGFAPNIGTLIVARIAQGIGAGLLTPGSLAIIQASIRKSDRAKAIGAWSGLGGVAAAAGPFLGGWLVDAFSWPWIFFLNIPLVIVSVLATLKWVPETRDETATGRFDITGNVLGALFLGGVTFALVQSGDPGPAIVAGVVGVACGIAFVIVERRSASPVLPPTMFASRQFTAINAVTFCVYAGLGGVLFFLVMQLQVVSGYSALEAGITMLPFTMLMLVFSARAGALGERLGPRLPLAVGSALSAIGILLLLGVGPDAPYLTRVLPGVLVLSVGMTITVAPLTAGVLAAADAAHAGVASGINNAVARAASLLAVAALPMAAGITGDSYEDPTAFAPGYRIAVVICAGLVLVGAVIAALLVSGREPEPEAPRPVCRTQCPYAAPQLEPDAEAATPS